jgi:hypothetical protein
MKRLLEEEHSAGSSDASLAELMSSMQPYEVNPFVKRRVLVSTLRHRPRLPFGLRPAVVATLLVCGTASAAVFGGRYIVRSFPGVLPVALRGVSVSNSKKPVAIAQHAAAATEALPATEVSTAPAALAGSETLAAAHADARASGVEPEVSVAPRARSSSAKLQAKSLERSRSGSSEDPSGVVDAIQALRRERDPSRAQTLLNRYLSTHPNGVLSEDALALSIEAASGRHDPRSLEYAQRYLSKFPNGKYRSLALRALGKKD